MNRVNLSNAVLVKAVGLGGVCNTRRCIFDKWHWSACTGLGILVYVDKLHVWPAGLRVIFSCLEFLNI